MPPIDLLEERVEVGKCWTIGEDRLTVRPNHGVELRLCLLLDIRPQRHRYEQRLQCCPLLSARWLISHRDNREVHLTVSRPAISKTHEGEDVYAYTQLLACVGHRNGVLSHFLLFSYQRWAKIWYLVDHAARDAG